MWKAFFVHNCSFTDRRFWKNFVLLHRKIVGNQRFMTFR
jgi:hypothetical protein